MEKRTLLVRVSMNTLHEDFGLAHDFLLEILKKKYKQKKFSEAIKEFFDDLNNAVQVTEEDIDEWIEECIWDADQMYSEGRITKEKRNDYIKLCQDREKVKKIIEKEENESLLQELIASAELISALLGKPTNSFFNFLKMYESNKKINENFKKMQSEYDKKELIELIPVILDNVVEEIKKDETIYSLGIYDDKDKEEWKKSVKELDENLRSFLRE